jgi:hypothetical protein
MEIYDYIEHEEGGATFSVDVSESQKGILINKGFEAIIREAIILNSEDDDIETVSVTFDPNKGWLGAIEELCAVLCDESRGDDVYHIPVNWLTKLVEDNWLDGIRALKLREEP